MSYQKAEKVPKTQFVACHWYISSWHEFMNLKCAIRRVLGVLDCFSCCNELICEIELCSHTAAPAAWHSVSVCCVLLDGSSHGEWKIREREKADGLPRGPGDRERERQGQTEKKREKCQLSLTYFAPQSCPPPFFLSLFPHLLLFKSLNKIHLCYNGFT